MDQALIDKVLGMLYGIHLGDAAGLPWETMTRNEVLEATAFRGVTGYSFPQQTKVKDTLMSSPGDTSDDTQLALVTLESLIAKRGLDLRDQAERRVAAYEHGWAFWGKTTIGAVLELREWLISDGTRGRKYDTPAPPSTDLKRGLGTGPSMVIAPLAAFMAIRYGYGHTLSPLAEATIALGRMTHSDIRASIAAVGVGAAIVSGLLIPNEDDFHLRHRLLSWSAIAEAVLTRQRSSNPKFSDALEHALHHTQSIGELRREVKAGFSSLRAVPLSLGIFLIHKDDFNAGLRAAINSGGDTDTMAALVGAMIGARIGASKIPERPWLIGLEPKTRFVYRKMAESLIYSARNFS